MRGFLAIAARELQERRLVFLAALVAGMVTVLVPYLPHVRGMHRGDTILIGAVAMAIALALGSAFLGGTSMLGRDLIERRMSFYLARPVRTITIWGGKMTAAVVLALASFVIVLVPAMLFQFSGMMAAAKRWQIRDVSGFTVVAVIVLAAVGAGHYLNVALRSRSPWVALDLGAPLAIAFVTWVVVGWFARGHATDLVIVTLLAIGGALIVAIWIAGAAGFVRGRAELREVHKWTSIALWSVMGGVVLLLAGYGVFVRTGDADDLRSLVAVERPHSGDYLLFGGRLRARGDYYEWFHAGPTATTPRSIGSPNEVALSDDGSVGALTEISLLWGSLFEGTPFASSTQRVIRADFTEDAPKLERTNLTLQGWIEAMDVSNDGRLAVITGELLSVWDLETEASIATAKVPRSGARAFRESIHFVDEGRIRLQRRVPGEAGTSTLVLAEFDLASKSWREGGTIPVARHGGVRTSRDRSKLLLRSPDRSAWALHDAVTGARIAVLDADPAKEGWAVFLADDRVLVFDHSAKRLMLYASDGRRLREVPAVESSWITPPSEPNEGYATLGIRKPGAVERASAFDLHMLNLQTGELRKVASNLIPLSWWSEIPTEPGRFATRLYESGDGAIVYFDPLTGERRIVAGRE